jgi:spermidine/putrescine transport system permease protein
VNVISVVFLLVAVTLVLVAVSLTRVDLLARG